MKSQEEGVCGMHVCAEGGVIALTEDKMQNCAQLDSHRRAHL